MEIQNENSKVENAIQEMPDVHSACLLNFESNFAF